MSTTAAAPRDMPIVDDASSHIVRWFAVALCLGAFIFDMYLIRSLKFDRFDRKLHRHFMSMIGHRGQHFLAYFTLNQMQSRGTALFAAAIVGLILVLAAAFVVVRRPWSAMLLGGAVAGIYAVSVILKHFIDRPGPVINGGDVGLKTFPSGHTAIGATTFLLAGYLVGRAIPRSRISLMTLGVMLTIAVSLSAATFHFPSEVFGGLVLTGAWLLILTAFAGRYLDQEPVDHIGSIRLRFGVRPPVCPNVQRREAARSARERRLDRFRR